MAVERTYTPSLRCNDTYVSFIIYVFPFVYIDARGLRSKYYILTCLPWIQQVGQSHTFRLIARVGPLLVVIHLRNR